MGLSGVTDLTFIQTLIIGSYVWSTTLAAAIWKRIESVRKHPELVRKEELAQLAERVKKLEAAQSQTPASPRS